MRVRSGIIEYFEGIMFKQYQQKTTYNWSDGFDRSQLYEVMELAYEVVGHEGKSKAIVDAFRKTGTGRCYTAQHLHT